MSRAEPDAGTSAARLLRWYPAAWRDRYGDEFAELLIADIEERPRSTARTLDVARGGIVARLADVGLAGFPLPAATAGEGATAEDRRRQVRASLGTLGAALAVCLTFGAAMQSQLTIAWEWSTTGVPSAADPDPVAFEARLATAACAVMAVFLAGVACWVGTGGEGSPLFHPGLIDVAATGALALALARRRPGKSDGDTRTAAGAELTHGE